MMLFLAADVGHSARLVLDCRRVLSRSERRDAVKRSPNRTGLGAFYPRARSARTPSMPVISGNLLSRKVSE